MPCSSVLGILPHPYRNYIKLVRAGNTKRGEHGQQHSVNFGIWFVRQSHTRKLLHDQLRWEVRGATAEGVDNPNSEPRPVVFPLA
jgi:hypothetical protein